MSNHTERTIIWVAIAVSVITLVAVVILTTVNRQPAEQLYAESKPLSEPPAKSTDEPAEIYTQSRTAADKPPLSEPFVESTPESAKTDIKPAKTPRLFLNTIIKNARTWRPAFSYWFGETAPDFTLTDITGKQHKLSDYQGKNVLILFWAVWCMPCRTEIPHLIELRNTIGEDKLAMLAISNEDPLLLERFVAQAKINYAVFTTNTRALPTPYNRVVSIPTTFFVDTEGKIKLAAEGVISLDEIKAALAAR